MTLGENLQRLRRERGLSQEDVAQKLFVSRQSVSKWELDQAEPGVEYLKALAELYGVTLDALLGRTPAPPEELPAPSEEDDEAEQDHIDSYRLFFALRTVAAIMTNLFFSLPAGGISFPFDWIFMLVGLCVRKSWVLRAIQITLGVNLFFHVIGLLGYSFGPWVGLVVNGVCLCVACNKGTKAYFGLPGKAQDD